MKISRNLHRGSLISLIGLLGYPCFVLAVIGYFVIPYIKPYFKEVVGIGLVTSLFFAIILLIPSFKWKKVMALIFALILSLSAFAKVSFYHHYGVKISASAFFVIFETHASEASDFLANYFDFFTIILLLLLVSPVLFIYWYCKKQNFFNNRSLYLFSAKWKFIGIIWIGFSAFCLYWKFQKENNVLVAINSYYEYVDFKEALKDNLAKPASSAFEMISYSDEPQTNIIIIGESTSNWHMQLYGYPRETNPLLNEIKNELYVFDSVISPHVHTLMALDKILTLTDYDFPKKEINGSVVQLANQADYETYWLSNQRPLGFHESVATVIGRASNKSVFTNSEDYTDVIHDEQILPYLDSILADHHDRKMIFIQLIGTHIDYKKRYPKSFDYFHSAPTGSNFSKKQVSGINEYDNAVRYNDFIIRSIIEKVRRVKHPGYIVYFSDHGDEVYDTMDFLGHNEYQATRPMYEIPFVVWMSEEFKRNRPEVANFESYKQRPYNLEDFMHSFSDLNGINFEGYHSEKSIFNEHFKKRIRWIKENVDYDNR